MVEQLKNPRPTPRPQQGGDVAPIAPLVLVRGIGGYPHTVEHERTPWGIREKRVRPTHINDLMRAAQALDWIKLCFLRGWNPDAMSQGRNDVLIWRASSALTEQGKRYCYCASWVDPESGLLSTDACPEDELPGDWLTGLERKLLETWAAIHMPY